MIMKIEFISYDGRFPNLCSGILTLRIDGGEKTFGSSYRGDTDYPRFWHSGGACGFNSDWSESYTETEPWEIDTNELPDELKQYAEELIDIFNNNVPYGCCGGCL